MTCYRSGLPAWFFLSIVLLLISWSAGHCLEGHLPSIADTLRIRSWRTLGPFSMGPREGVIGLMEDTSVLRPDRSERYPSTLAPGGYVGWKTASLDSAGWVNVVFDDVSWDTLTGIYGYAGIVNGAYAYAEFDVPSASRALVVAERVGSFQLNGRLWPGDPYGHGFMRVPVVLRQGKNRVVVNLSGYGDHTFKLVFLPVAGPVISVDDYTLPDIVLGERGTLRAGIPVLNTTETRLEDISISAGDGVFTAVTERAIPVLPPLCIVKVPIEILVKALPDSGDLLAAPVAVSTAGYVHRDTLHLRLRTEGQSLRRTFISRIDGSCQYYALLPPSDLKTGRRYGLILSLHGANVKAERQADAYQPKSWAYVVAPTNRRRFGFDWQDWGRLDALEVLRIAKSTLPVDTNRVYLTGHSMGGHGAWHVGLSHPDLFAALAPAAGWTCFELYVPWFLQKAYIHGDPGQRGIRETALRQDWSHIFLENARNLPVFVLQGGADDNVPPFHSRLFASRLDELGYPYRYKEDPGKGHWYRIDSLDVACVDDPDLMGFFDGKVRDEFPRNITFKTVNPSHSRHAYWLEIVEQERLYSESMIKGRVSSDTVRIEAHNIKSLALTLSRRLIPSGCAVVEIEGRRWNIRFDRDRKLRFSRRGGQFRRGENRSTGLRKRPGQYGPIKQAMFSPFVFVYGTRGGADVTDLLLHLARLDAFQWWRRGNGFVQVMPDLDVTAAVMADYNLLLFGGPKENSVVGRINRFLPIRAARGGIVLGEDMIHGDGLAVRFVYPNPLAPERLVVVNEGTDPEGLELLTSMRTVYAGAGLPDFVILGSEVRRRGWAGVAAAGFFDSAWRVEPNLSYRQVR